MAEKNDGGPAYPHERYCTGEDTSCEHLGGLHAASAGMSLRDYFAGLALMGLAALPQAEDTLAKFAYRQADAMIAEREKAN